MVADAERTSALSETFGILALIFAVDLLWAVSYTIWPKKPAGAAPSEAPH